MCTDTKIKVCKGVAVVLLLYGSRVMKKRDLTYIQSEKKEFLLYKIG